MAANIRYTIADSNRIRVPANSGTVSVLTVVLTASDLSFEEEKKSRRSYGGNREVLILSEMDTQNLTMSYVLEDGLNDHSIKHVREWYKSIRDGTTFEIDTDGSGYEFCQIISDSYKESRRGTLDEFSVSFRVEWA